MKAYYIFQQADEETISNILDWMRNQERAIYRAAVRELGALKKLRPEFIQRKPLQEQFSFIKKMLSWKPSNEIGPAYDNFSFHTHTGTGIYIPIGV